MKAINKKLSVKSISVLGVVLLGVFFSCNNGNEVFNSVDTQNINSINVSSAFYAEGSELALNLIKGLSTAQYAGSRTTDVISGPEKYDVRLTGATVTVTRTGTISAPAGMIIMAYDSLNKSTTGDGIIRKGKILIDYSGKKWDAGFVVNLQFQNFYWNYTHLEGSVTDSIILATDTTRLQFASRLENGKVTFGDGKFILHNHSLTRIWYRSLLSENNEWHITGSASGNNKKGNEYQLSTQTDLVYRVFCVGSKSYIPVKGTAVINIISGEKKMYQLNYGDGTCDNLISVKADGNEKLINATTDGN
ncbi:MAG: hypothetical protein JST48_02330 [Bacteroidetes bacterium]|nr:hypothetical protein [Bacteroidota bacterium]